MWHRNNDKQNIFTVLADSDSESDVDSSVVELEPEGVAQTIENSIEIKDIPKNLSAEQVTQPPAFRTWVRTDSENRFSGEEVKKNIFSSPFSKQKHIHKHWNQPRFREDSDGWVSIRWSQPQFQESETTPTEQLSVEYEPRKEEEKREEKEFPSLLTRGTSNVVIHQDVNETLSALAWAEKIKKSLEKAELARAVKSKELSSNKDPVGRLSFFRRPMIVQQSEV